MPTKKVMFKDLEADPGTETAVRFDQLVDDSETPEVSTFDKVMGAVSDTAGKFVDERQKEAASVARFYRDGFRLKDVLPEAAQDFVPRGALEFNPVGFGSDAYRYGLFRAFQGLNPFAGGSAMARMDEEVQTQRLAQKAEDEIGAVLKPVGLERFAPEVTGTMAAVSNMAPMMAGSARRGVQVAESALTSPMARSALEAMKQALPRAARGFGTELMENAAFNAMGGETGQRMEEGASAFTDPRQLLLAALGPGLGVLGAGAGHNIRLKREGELSAARAEVAAAEAEVQSIRNATFEAVTGEPAPIKLTNVVAGPMDPRSATVLEPGTLPAEPRTAPLMPWEAPDDVRVGMVMEDVAREQAKLDAAKEQLTPRTRSERISRPVVTAGGIEPTYVPPVTMPALQQLPSLADVDLPEAPTQPRTALDMARVGVEVQGGSGGKPPPLQELPPEPGATVTLSPAGRKLYEARQKLAALETKYNAKATYTPGPPILDELPVDAPVTRSAQEAGAVFNAAKRQSEGWFNRVAKEALLPEDRAPSEIAPIVRSWTAGQRIGDFAMERYYPKLNDAIRKLSPEQRQMLRRFTAQNVSPEDAAAFRKRNPHLSTITVDQLPEPVREVYQRSVNTMRAQRNDLIRAGYFTPEAVERMYERDRLGEVWLHREFMAFLDRKNFKPSAEKFERAVKFVKEKSARPIDDATAERYLMELVSPDGKGDAKQRWKASQLKSDVLKGRSEIPAPLREWLGEVHDPAFVLAQSMSQLEQLHHQYKVTQAFTTPDLKGKVWDTDPTAGMHPTKIPNEKKLYGEFAGKYVQPQLFEAVMQGGDSAQMQLAATSITRELVNYFRAGKVLFSPVTALRNFIGNFAFMSGGGLPPWNPRFGPRLKQAVAAVADYGRSFSKAGAGSSPTQGRDWVQWAMEDGAYRSGRGTEFGGGAAQLIAKKMLKEPAVGAGKFMAIMREAMPTARQKLGAYYELMDTIPRMAVYIDQVTQGIEKLQLDVATARARAAKIVNENFASGGNIGLGARRLSNSDIGGMMAPFLSWHADNMRVHYNWLRNAKDVGALFKPGSGTGAGQALNVGLYYGVLLTGTAALMRRMAGWTDEEMQEAQRSLKPGYEENNPFYEFLPWRDAKGRPQVVSLEALVPTAVFLKGDKSVNPLARVVANSALGFVSGGLAEQGVASGLSGMGLISRDDMPYGQRLVPGQEVYAGLKGVWDYLRPTLLNSTMEAARRAGVAGQLGKFEEAYTPMQGLARALSPLPVEPVGARSRAARLNVAKAKQATSKGDTRYINRMEGRNAPTPEERRRLHEETLKQRGANVRKATQ